MSRGHRFGHHEPVEETLALLAPSGALVFIKSDSGFAAGPSANFPVVGPGLQLVQEAGTVTVADGDFLIIHTSVEYVTMAEEIQTGQQVEQFIKDNTGFVWDDVVQNTISAQDKVVGRHIRLGPVGAVGQPAAGTYQFSVFAGTTALTTPPVHAVESSIVVEVTSG